MIDGSRALLGLFPFSLSPDKEAVMARAKRIVHRGVRGVISPDRVRQAINSGIRNGQLVALQSIALYLEEDPEPLVGDVIISGERNLECFRFENPPLGFPPQISMNLIDSYN